MNIQKHLVLSVIILGNSLFCNAEANVTGKANIAAKETNRDIAADSCAGFLGDFKKMIQAQESIQQSLISNHDMMADSLDTYADALKETSGKAYKKVTENMYKAGESVRKRKTKAAEISKEFSEKALEMLKTAEKCVRK